MQWGNVERPTHRNTSWDWARFETCAHKWADLSEGDYGVALLNDCKYGYDVHDNVIRLTLLKSATSPDPIADEGEHRMTYSLLPHTRRLARRGHPGSLRPQRPADPAAGQRRRGQRGAGVAGGGRCPNVVIETIKQAEDGNGMIVRLYEDQRRRGKFTLTTSFPLAHAYHCNLLEEDDDEIPVQGGNLVLEIKPYQIINLRLVPQA